MLRKAGRLLRSIYDDQRGQTMLEYIIIVIIVVIAGIAAFKIIRDIIIKGASSLTEVMKD